MKTGWVTKRLGEVCDVLDSQRKPVTKSDRNPGPYPYYGATCQVDSVDKWLFDESLVLLGEDGANWSSGAQSAYIIHGKTWVNNHAHVLRTNPEIVSDRWLCHYLNYADLTQWVTGVTVPKLNQKHMVEIPLLLPPLAEQKRIVAKIDAAFEKIDKLKANAERNLKNAKELFQSALNEAMRPKPGWVEKRLGEIAEFKNGLNFKRKAGGCKISIVGVSDFSRTSSIEDCTPLDSVEIEDVPGAEWYLHPDDFVFVRSNGSKKLVGRVLHIKTDRRVTFSGFCIRMRMADRSILPGFLFL